MASTKLAALRAREAERQSAREAEEEAREEEALTRKEEALAAGLKEHVDFDIVTSEVGVFVVGRPEFVVGKRFVDAETKSTEDTVTFALACVRFPNAETARALFVAHAGLASEVALVALRLFGLNVGARRGKA